MPLRSPSPLACAAVLFACLLFAGAGCATKTHLLPQSAADSALDPCASHLHEISGLLLEYYATHQALPQSLNDLRPLAVGEPKDLFQCPATGKPFIYNPKGIKVIGPLPGRIVVYETQPPRNDIRWGILITDPRGSEPPSARVVAVPREAVHG